LAQDGSITLTQKRQYKNLSVVNTTPVDSTSSREVTHGLLTPKDQYIAQYARGAYIASVCQLEALFNLFFAAQASNPKEVDIRELNKRLSWQI